MVGLRYCFTSVTPPGDYYGTVCKVWGGLRVQRSVKPFAHLPMQRRRRHNTIGRGVVDLMSSPIPASVASALDSTQVT